VAYTRLAAGSALAGREPVQMLAAGAGTDLLGVVAGDPADLSMRTLSRTITHMQDNGQEVRRYRFAFWSAVSRLLAIVFAVMLAVPLLTSTLRTADGGARMTLGLVLGLGYFMMQRMVESGTIAFALNPVLLAFLPTLLLAAIVALLLARQR
jgi:lipopolysaccharide export system permease protein